MPHRLAHSLLANHPMSEHAKQTELYDPLPANGSSAPGVETVPATGSLARTKSISVTSCRGAPFKTSGSFRAHCAPSRDKPNMQI